MPCPLLGDLSISETEPRSPTLQVDSLPAEPRGKSKNTGVGSLIPSPGDLPNLGINLTKELDDSYTAVGKESACNAGDPSSIPGSGISTGEGIGYPLQYSWVSPATQLVKNLPAVQETWV